MMMEIRVAVAIDFINSNRKNIYARTLSSSFHVMVSSEVLNQCRGLRRYWLAGLVAVALFSLVSLHSVYVHRVGNYAGKVALVTGGLGFIGSHLTGECTRSHPVFRVQLVSVTKSRSL